MTPDVVVVGAGFAGLSAAARLSASHQVLVLEARSRLGGRATAFTDRETGELVDNGQHVLFGCYRETMAFLGAVGAGGNVRVERQLRISLIEQGGRPTTLSCPPLPPPLHLLAGIFEWDALGWRDRISALRMAAPLKIARRAIAGNSRRIAASPGETVEQWLVRNGQTPRLRELLWDPLALAALNQPPTIAAAPPFARVLAEMFSDDPEAAAVVLPAKPLHEMYAEPARAAIERQGGVIRTGTPARITVRNGRIAHVSSGADTWTPSTVICAVPWFAIADAFAGDLDALRGTLDCARRMTDAPIVTVNLWFDRAVMDAPFVGLPGRTMQWVFDKRAVFGEQASHLSLVSSGAADIVSWSNEALIAEAEREIVDALPAARAARVIRATVIREPRATFSLAPGQPPRPGTRTPIPGLFLAGDWIETGLPATIESAVRSGHAAAREATEALRHGEDGHGGTETQSRVL